MKSIFFILFVTILYLPVHTFYFIMNGGNKDIADISSIYISSKLKKKCIYNDRSA